MSNPWNKHLASYRAKHPGLSLKEAMQGASKSYKKIAGGGEKKQPVLVGGQTYMQWSQSYRKTAEGKKKLAGKPVPEQGRILGAEWRKLTGGKTQQRSAPALSGGGKLKGGSKPTRIFVVEWTGKAWEGEPYGLKANGEVSEEDQAEAEDMMKNEKSPTMPFLIKTTIEEDKISIRPRTKEPKFAGDKIKVSGYSKLYGVLHPDDIKAGSQNLRYADRGQKEVRGQVLLEIIPAPPAGAPRRR